jgi:ribosomal protein S18 acetylase RimI-like enzyme
VCPVTAEEAVEWTPALVRVYRQAFGGPGYEETEKDVARFARDGLPRHAAREGFRCVVAAAGDDVIGFAYGYTGRRGQWWTDQLAARAPAHVVEGWLDGHFEFVELAVDPAVRRRGYGRALHDELMIGVPHENALLTTYADDRPAPRLYRRMGWQLLAEQVFPGRDLYGLRVRPWAQSRAQTA